MRSGTDEALPSADEIDPGVFADLRRLIVWQCAGGDPPRRIGMQRPLTVALDSSGELLEALGLTAVEAKARLDEVLPRERAGLSEVGLRLYAVRAMLGLLDSVPDYDTIVLGSETLRLGDAEVYPSTVEKRGLDFSAHLLVRKTFVAGLFGNSEPSGIRLGSPAVRQMAQALAGALGLVRGFASRSDAVRRRPHALLSQQLATRLNEHAAGYPTHLTPDVLVESLTLSNFSVEQADEPSQGQRGGLYADVHSRSGNPALDVVARERRLVVLGNPGGGKSTVLSAAVVSAANSGSPVAMVRLSSFAARGTMPRNVESALAVLMDTQSEDLGVALPEDSADIARSLAQDSTALIALDGLDEVHPDDLERVHNLLRLLSGIPGRIVISSRIAGYTTPVGQWREVTVDALAPADAERFLESWFRDEGDGVVRARAALDSPAGKALAETPVLLGIIATVAEADDVPLVVAHLYDHYVSHYLRGKWRHRSQWLPVASIPDHLAAARSAGWLMATGMTGLYDGTRWSDTITYRALTRIDGFSEPRIALELAERHGVLVPHGRQRSELHQQYRWMHRTVHEHLVGGYLADLVHSGEMVPDELLMGPTQWDLPLRHMIGLLEEHHARRVFERVAELQRRGDPGGVIEGVVQRMAFGLPPGSSLLAERAQAMAAVGAWYSAIELDTSIIDDQYAAAIEQHDERAITLQSYVLRSHTPAEGVARRFVAALSAARLTHEGHLRGHVDSAFEQAVSWLSREDPDAALAALLEAATARYLDPPFTRWLGAAPSRALVAQAVVTVAEWEPQNRLHYLDFLAEVGAELDQFVEPAGPLRALDVHVSTALWRARRVEFEDSLPYVLPDDVIDTIMAGTYGADAAYDMATRSDLGGRNKGIPGLGPALAQQAADLYEIEANAGPETTPNVAASALTALTFEDILTIEKLPDALAAARLCLENAARVPIQSVLQLQWNLAALDDEPRPGPFHPSLHWPFNAVKDAFAKVCASRGTELIYAILASDPAQWIIRPPVWADYSAVYALSGARALSTDDMLKLTEWAAAAGGQMLRYVARDSIAEDFITQLHSRDEDAIRVNLWEVADALARLGHLADWRERLVALGPGA